MKAKRTNSFCILSQSTYMACIWMIGFSHSHRYTCWFPTVGFDNGITCVFDFDGNTKRQFELTDCCLFTTSTLYTVDLSNGFLFISACVTFFLLYDQVCAVFAAVAYIFIRFSWFVFVISKHYTERSIVSKTKPSKSKREQGQRDICV